MGNTGLWRRGGGLVLFLALVSGIGACEDEATNPAGLAEEGIPDLEALEPGIHTVFLAPSLTSAHRGEPLSMSVHLLGVGIEEEIASYQGEIRYDSGKVQIGTIGVPDGLMAVWNQVEEGLIRFAGVAIEGLSTSPILLFELTSDGPVHPSDFEVEIEEIIASEGFKDLTGNASSAKEPVITSQLAFEK